MEPTLVDITIKVKKFKYLTDLEDIDEIEEELGDDIVNGALDVSDMFDLSESCDIEIVKS